MVKSGVEPWIARVTQVGLAALLVAAHVDAGFPFLYPHYVLLILFHAPLVRWLAGMHVTPRQTVWIATALFLHPIGGLYGWYVSVWWWDHLTHTASATLVGAIGFTIARARELRRPAGRRRRWRVRAFTVVFVVVAGVLWEAFERVSPSLSVYGPVDTQLDMVFNVVGALLVAFLGRAYLADRAAEFHETLSAGEIPVAMDGDVLPRRVRDRLP